MSSLNMRTAFGVILYASSMMLFLNGSVQAQKVDYSDISMLFAQEGTDRDAIRYSSDNPDVLVLFIKAKAGEGQNRTAKEFADLILERIKDPRYIEPQDTTDKIVVFYTEGEKVGAVLSPLIAGNLPDEQSYTPGAFLTKDGLRTTARLRREEEATRAADQ